MSLFENPNCYNGTDGERIQLAVDAAAKGCGRVVIPRCNDGQNALDPQLWILEEAIRLPSRVTVELDGCHLKLSDQCRDNFFRSANCGIDISPIETAEDIHIIGHPGAVLEGADHPRATGDGNKVLGERTFATDAGKQEESQRGDWRNIGILLAHVQRFSIQNIRIIDSHCWAISLETCSHGTLRDINFNNTGKKIIDGRTEAILNQDGIDLRLGCHDILIENISGQTGDDLVALTAIPNAKRQDGNVNSTMISADIKSTFNGIRNIIIRNIHGHCAGGHHIVMLLNTNGAIMEDILIDGIVDTSAPPYQSKAALRIGHNNPLYGGASPLGTTRRIIANNIISRAKYAVSVGGTLCDSSISNVIQNGGDHDAVYFESGAENVHNVIVHNARIV